MKQMTPENCEVCIHREVCRRVSDYALHAPRCSSFIDKRCVLVLPSPEWVENGLKFSTEEVEYPAAFKDVIHPSVSTPKYLVKADFEYHWRQEAYTAAEAETILIEKLKDIASGPVYLR